MEINQQQYNNLPFVARLSTLIMWGTPLNHYSESGQFHQLYLLNDFFAELCFDEQQQKLTHVSTFSDTDRLEPYLSAVQWQDLMV